MQVEKIMFSQAGRLAQTRLASGSRLNHLEAVVCHHPSFTTS